LEILIKIKVNEKCQSMASHNHRKALKRIIVDGTRGDERGKLIWLPCDVHADFDVQETQKRRGSSILYV